MQKKQKPETCESGEPADNAAEGTTVTDQMERRYYYDDAHGYETFDPDAADDKDQKTG